MVLREEVSLQQFGNHEPFSQPSQMLMDGFSMATSLPGIFELLILQSFSAYEHFRSSELIQQEKILRVDLDQERGIPPRKDRPNIHTVKIRAAAKNKYINLSNVREYLEGKTQFGPEIYEAISKSRQSREAVIPKRG